VLPKVSNEPHLVLQYRIALTPFVFGVSSPQFGTLVALTTVGERLDTLPVRGVDVITFTSLVPNNATRERRRRCL
jgi:hypothetical protein